MHVALSEVTGTPLNLLLQTTIHALPNSNICFKPTTMPSRPDIDNFVLNLVNEFDWHLNKTGCFGGSHPFPCLENEILPMFTTRWASGPNQRTASYFSRIKPTLKLASRLLTEDWPLMWFYNLTFGTQRAHPLLKDTKYLEHPTKYLPANMAVVKKNIRELGEVITFMHAPSTSTKLSYGTTYRRKFDAPSFDSFRESDWPSCSDQFDASGKRRLRPCIVLNPYFQDYFLDRNGWDSASQTSRYRTLFVFAVTLCHEFVHAYWHWLYRYADKEPCWNKSERVNELGFSWERQVIGRVVCPVQFKNFNGYRILFSAEIQEYKNAQEYFDMVANVDGMARAYLTTRDAKGKERLWPLLEPSDVRGSPLYLGRRCESFLALVTCLPMSWVVAWFQEKFWRDGKRMWDEKDNYLAQPVQNPFMVVYKRNTKEAWVFRPLREDHEVDRRILKEMGKGAQR
jgi:hypothetical protein